MTAHHRRSTLALVIATQVVCGCARLNAKTTADATSPLWPASLGLAQQRAADGRLEAADSALAEYAMHHPGTNETLETAYWRALYKLDPGSPHASLTSAMASLDAYLADTRPRQHVAEAGVLRRMAGELDALGKQAATATAQAKDAATLAANVKAQSVDAKVDAKAGTETPATEEVKRLKDELAKANAELERIRKRLSQPPPPREP